MADVTAPSIMLSASENISVVLTKPSYIANETTVASLMPPAPSEAYSVCLAVYDLSAQGAYAHGVDPVEAFETEDATGGANGVGWRVEGVEADAAGWLNDGRTPKEWGWEQVWFCWCGKL